MTTAEAAEYIGVKKSYLMKLMMKKAIPYYKPNGKLCYFDEADLNHWLRRVRIPSEEELDQQAQKYLVNRKGV
jgi:excisionase family DNA binding protein